MWLSFVHGPGLLLLSCMYTCMNLKSWIWLANFELGPFFVYGIAGKGRHGPPCGRSPHIVCTLPAFYRLPTLMNRKFVDEFAVEFCMTMNTKANRKKLARALFNVDKNRWVHCTCTDGCVIVVGWCLTLKRFSRLNCSVIKVATKV